jgi:hypothetical protein
MVALPIADGLPVVVAFAVLKARTRQAESGLFVTGVKLGSGAGDVDDPQSRGRRIIARPRFFIFPVVEVVTLFFFCSSFHNRG